MNQPQWTTRDGRKVAVKDMTDAHLLNAHRMLIEQGCIGPSTLSFYLTCTGPSGEMAQDAFDRELNSVLNAPVSAFVDLFEAELKHRGLTPLEARRG